MNKDILIKEFESQKESGYKDFEYWMAHIIALKSELNEYDKSILKENCCRQDKIKNKTWNTLFYNNIIDKDSYFEVCYCIEMGERKFYGNGGYKNGALQCKEIDRNTFIDSITNEKFIELLKYV